MTASRTRIPWVMTSGPMPSPGMTAIRNGIASAYPESFSRKVLRLSSIPLRSADEGDGPERSPGQDAPSPPRPPHLPSNLLGHLGIRRAGLPRAARRRHRRSRVRLARLPGRFDESSQDLGGTPAVQRLATDLHGLGPILRSTGSQDRRGRIEENDIAAGPDVTVQHLAQQRSVFGRRAALQIIGASPRKTKVLRVELEVIDLAFPQLKDP